MANLCRPLFYCHVTWVCKDLELETQEFPREKLLNPILDENFENPGQSPIDRMVPTLTISISD